MRHRFYWIVLAAVAAIGAITAFGWMTMNTAESKSGGWISATVLLALGVAGAIAYYVLASKEVSTPGRPFWTTPKGVATLVSAALAGLAAMSLMFPLLDPPNATRADVEKEGRRTRKEIADRLPPPERTRRILTALPGRWGEAGCRVVYQFRVEDGAVLIDLIRKEPGMAAYAMAASILPGGSGDVIHATVERSSETDEPGDSVVFTYAATGAGERLNWLNRSQTDVGGLELDRCGEGG